MANCWPLYNIDRLVTIQHYCNVKLNIESFCIGPGSSSDRSITLKAHRNLEIQSVLLTFDTSLYRRRYICQSSRVVPSADYLHGLVPLLTLCSLDFMKHHRFLTRETTTRCKPCVNHTARTRSLQKTAVP